MIYSIKRTEQQINDVLNKADESESSGRSEVPGMTYEQGVKNALLWVFGDYDDAPLDL